MLEMIGGSGAVTAGQMRSAAVGELLGVHLHGQSKLRGFLVYLLALSDSEADALAKYVHAVDQAFVRQRGQHFITNHANVIVGTARELGRQSMRPQKSGV